MSSASPTPPKSKQAAKRRPGRIRRWIVRPVVWVLVLLLLAAFAGLLVLQSEWLGHRAGAKAQEWLAERIDRPVHLGRLGISLLPLGLVAEDLRIGGVEPEDPPFATVERLILDLELSALRPLELRARLLQIEGPHLRVSWNQEGEPEFPKFQGRDQGARRNLSFSIGSLVIEQGSLEVGHREIPLDLVATGVEGQLVGASGGALKGLAGAEEVEVLLPGGRPYRGALRLSCVLTSERMEIASLQLDGPELSARLHGSVHWTGQREVILLGRVEGSGALLTALGYLENQVEGPVQFDGGFAWRSEAWGFRGQLSSPRLSLFGRRLDGLRGGLAGDRNGLRIEVAEAVYLGGTVTGGLEWPTGGREQPLELDLTLEGAALEPLLLDQGIPLEGLHGLVSGSFDYRFEVDDPAGGAGWGDFRIIRPPGPPRSGLAVRGSAALAIEGGRLQTRAVRLRSTLQEFLVEGEYDLKTARGEFGLEVKTEAIQELVALLPLELDPAPLWAPTKGRGRLEGRLAVSPEDLGARVSMDLLEVEAPGVSAEGLRGGFTVTPRGLTDLRVELQRPEAGMMVTGSVPFEVEESGDGLVPFRIGVDAVSWPFHDVAAWIPAELPVDGRFSGSIELWGDPEQPTGEVRISTGATEVAGVKLDSLSAELSLNPGGLEIGDLKLAAPAGELLVRGAMDWAGEAISLSLRSGELALDREPFSQWMPGSLGGILRVEGSVAGGVDDPRIVLRLGAEALAVKGRTLGQDGSADLHVSLESQRLRAGGSLLGLLRLEGGGEATRDRIDLAFDLESDSLQGIVRTFYEGELPEVEGSLRGELRVAADLQDRDSWLAEVELASLEMAVDGRRLRNRDDVRVSIRPTEIRVENFYLADEADDSELFLVGEVGLDESLPLDLRVQSSLTSEWLRAAVPEVDLRRGHIDLLARVRGSLLSPEVDGQAELREGQVLIAGLPHALNDLQAIALLYPDRIVLDSARAGFAGGSLQASGSLAELRSEGGPSYRLQLAGERLSVRYPEGWLLQGSPEVVIESTPGGRQIRGRVDLDDALYLRDVSVGAGQLLRGLFERQRMEVESTDEMLVTTQLNILVEGEDALQIRNNLAKLRGSLDLTLRGNLARPVAFGVVEIDPGGTLVWADNEYRLQQTQLTFANPQRILPILDLVASTEIREYDVILNLSGPLDRLNATFSSDPPMADLEVLALMATGQTGLVSEGRGRKGSSSVAAETFLYGQATSLITERVNRLFGLDTLRVDPLTSATGDLSSARVTLGEQISRDLFATYTFDPSDTSQQILQLEWAVNRSLTLVVTQNGDGTYAVDARWQKEL